jgi:hypothetical protein
MLFQYALICVLIQTVICDFGAYKAVDLTHVQDEKALGWPTFKPFERSVAYKGYAAEWGQPDQW